MACLVSTKNKKKEKENIWKEIVKKPKEKKKNKKKNEERRHKFEWEEKILLWFQLVNNYEREHKRIWERKRESKKGDNEEDIALFVMPMFFYIRFIPMKY